MSWQAGVLMDLRHEFVTLAHTQTLPMRELCRRFGSSPKTGYTWLARHTLGGDAALADRSRRPHTSPGRTSPDLEARVLDLRDEHACWGGRKLRARLLALGLADVPSASTSTAILRRHDRLDPSASAARRADTPGRLAGAAGYAGLAWPALSSPDPGQGGALPSDRHGRGAAPGWLWRPGALSSCLGCLATGLQPRAAAAGGG